MDRQKSQRAVIAVALVIGSGVVAWWWIRPSDSRWIERQLMQLCRLAEKNSEEPMIVAARRADRIAMMMTEDVQLNSTQPWAVSISSRGEVRRAVLETRAMVRRLHVSIDDLQTEVTADRLAADQRCTIRVRVDGGGWSDAQARELALRWRREPDGWRIATAHLVDVIRALPLPNRSD